MTQAPEKTLNAEKLQQIPKKEKEGKRLPHLTDPEGFLIFVWAVILDLMGLMGFLPLIGQALSFIPDVLGTITIGVWLWSKTGKLSLTKGASSRLTRRFALGGILEYIPIVGILPGWTVAVLSILGKQHEEKNE